MSQRLSSYSSTATFEPAGEPTTTEVASYSVSPNVGGAILLYIILFCLSFIVLITFDPSFVQQKGLPPGSPTQPDFGKCFITSLIVSLLLCLIIWLFLSRC